MSEIHIIPTDKEHDESRSCWCMPEVEHIDSETGKTVIVHRDVH